MPNQGIGKLEVFGISSEKIVSLGRNSHLWNLSKAGGCVFTGNSLKFKVGDQVSLAVHSDCPEENYSFQAIICWVDQIWFGFKFASTQDSEWVLKHLPSNKFKANSHRVPR